MMLCRRWYACLWAGVYSVPATCARFLQQQLAFVVARSADHLSFGRIGKTMQQERTIALNVQPMLLHSQLSHQDAHCATNASAPLLHFFF